MIYNSPEDKKTSTSCLCVLGWAGLRTDYTVSSTHYSVPGWLSHCQHPRHATGLCRPYNLITTVENVQGRVVFHYVNLVLYNILPKEEV